MSGGAMAGLQLASSVLGPILGGMEQSSQLRASADADRQNALRTTYQGEVDAYQVERNSRLAVGAGLSQAAAGGNVVGTGTVADLVEQSALNREMDIANLRYSAAQSASNLNTQAATKSRAASSALFNGFLGGALGFMKTSADQRNQARILTANAANRASEAAPPLARSTTSAVPSGGGQALFGVARSRWNSSALPGW